MPPTPAEALNTSLSRNLSGRGDPVTDPVTDKCLDRCINRAARKQMPPDQHRRLLSLLCLMQLSIQWWLAKRADDLKQVPLAVAREHLKAEHEAFARESELLDAQRKQIDSEKQMLARAKSFLDRERQALAAEKRKLFVERQHLEAEKKMVRARHEALVQASVPILEQEERMTIIPQETGSLGGKPQHSNSEVSRLPAHLIHQGSF